MAFHIFAEPIVSPPSDQYVASNSMETLNYNCTVDAGYRVIWEVNRIQYRSRVAQFTTSDDGISLMIISLDSNDRVSRISFSNVTRGKLSLLCVAAPLVGLRNARDGEEYTVESFGKPG